MVTYRWSCLAGLVAAALLLVAGCGDSSSPGEDAPAIASALGDVDNAIVDGRFDRARARLGELVDATTSAREADELEGSEADRILAAAAELLLSALPQTEEAPNPGGAPAEGDVPVEEVPSDEGDSEEDEKELEKKLEEEQKKLEKEQKKEDEGRGNGDSSENGPDDDEGN